MPPKPDLVFNTAPTDVETDHPTFTVKLSPTKPDQDMSLTNRPSALIVEDWVFDSKDESETKAPQIVPSFVYKSKSHKLWQKKEYKSMLCVQKFDLLIKDCDFHAKKMAQPIARNHAHRGNHQQYAPLNYQNPQKQMVHAAVLTQSKPVFITDVRPVSVAVPKFKVNRPRHAAPIFTKIKSPIRRHITRSTSPEVSNSPPRVTAVKALVVNDAQDFKLPDESQVLLRVPWENNMYNVYLKNIVSSGDLTCLFAKATIDESNLWHRRLGHINFKTMNKLLKGSGPTWLFDIDSLTKTMNYQPVTTGNQSNPSEGFQDKFDAEKAGEEIDQQYVLFPVWSSGSTNLQNANRDAAFDGKEHEFDAKKPESEVIVSLTKFEDYSDNSINEVNAASTLVPTVGQISPNSTNTFSADGPSNAAASPTYRKSSFIDASQFLDDPDMPELEDITYSDDEDDVGAETDFNNLETSIIEELFQFKMQKVWILVDLPHRKRAIGIKWVFRNKKDERGIVIRNKARLVTQGHTQEEGINYEDVFALVARIEAIRLFLAYASFMGFMVYQMDVNSAFLYGTIKEEVYVCQPLGFEDPDHPDKVYKVVNALYGLHQAPRAWYETLANYLLENGFQRGKIDQTLFIKRQKGDILLVQIYVDDIIFGATNKDLCKSFEKLIKHNFQMSSMGELTFFLGLRVKQKKDVIFISQDKYVAEILRKFGLTEGKSANTPIDTEKPLLKDPGGEDVDVHTYSDSPLLGVNTPRCDDDRLELKELMVFLLLKVEKVGIGSDELVLL
nr:putative ribonuclease H-like domain-containing protein [Tanacetum cinerariifolium]